MMRYFKEETRGPKISPKVVIYFTIAVIIFEILMRPYGMALLGF